MTDKYSYFTGTKKSAYVAGGRQPSWSFVSNWNLSLDKIERYEAKPRNYLWASQLGTSLVDIYLSLNGVEKSNDFDLRAKKKFDAGVFWEWIACLVAKRAGIFIDTQQYVIFRYPGLLAVGGVYDLKVGGKRNFEMAEKVGQALKLIELPERFIEAMELVAEKVNLGTDLPERIVEVKSCSSFMFDAQYYRGVPSENHALQAFHYLKGSGVREGAVLYISKDDCRMVEIPIWADDKGLEERYHSTIELISAYYEKKEQPPKEPHILFDYDKGRFCDNWNIKYSAYLTYLYGFEREGEYEDAFKGKIASWNRVLGRIVRGEKMTKNNEGYIEEMRGLFPNFDEIVEVAKKTGPRVEAEEGGEEKPKGIIAGLGY